MAFCRKPLLPPGEVFPGPPELLESAALLNPGQSDAPRRASALPSIDCPEAMLEIAELTLLVVYWLRLSAPAMQGQITGQELNSHAATKDPHATRKIEDHECHN